MRAIRVSSLLRALGPAIAVAVPAGVSSRSSIQASLLTGTDLASRELDSHGIQLIAWTPDEGATFTRLQTTGSRALTTGTWVAAALLLTRFAGRLPVPVAVRVVTTGVLVYVLDQVVVDRLEAALDRLSGADEQNRVPAPPSADGGGQASRG